MLYKERCHNTSEKDGGYDLEYDRRTCSNMPSRWSWYGLVSIHCYDYNPAQARNVQPQTASAMTTAKQRATRTGGNTHVLFLPQREHCVTAETYSKHQAEQRLRRTMCLASQRAEKRRRARLQRLQEAEARRYSRSR